MLLKYLEAAMQKAHYEILEDDESIYGEIPGIQGVYANAKALEECRTTLMEILEEWVLVRVSQGLNIPIINGIEVKVKKVAA